MEQRRSGLRLGCGGRLGGPPLRRLRGSAPLKLRSEGRGRILPVRVCRAMITASASLARRRLPMRLRTQARPTACRGPLAGSKINSDFLSKLAMA